MALTHAETMTPEARRKSRNCATLSACFGAVPAIMLQDSALIILYATMLGAGPTYSLITTSFAGLCSMFLLIPCAYVTDRIGIRKTILNATFLGGFLFLLIAVAPYAGRWSTAMLLISALLYTISSTFYASSWFPLLDQFLLPEDRAPYFSWMRFSWQITSALFIFGSGALLGANPPLWLLQVIIVCASLLAFGRTYFIAKVPVPEVVAGKLDFKEALLTSIRNQPLSGFSVYLFCLYLAAAATVPLTFLYLKDALQVAGNVVVMISALAMSGTVCGFLCAGKLIGRLGTKRLLLAIHFLFSGVNFTLFFIHSGALWALILTTGLLALYSFFISCASVIITMEMMVLAKPGNRTMAMAFCGSFYAAGSGMSRLLSSLVIGSGALAAEWSLGAMRITRYHTMFLFFGIMILFVCLLLVIVPAIFPKDAYAHE